MAIMVQGQYYLLKVFCNNTITSQISINDWHMLCVTNVGGGVDESDVVANYSGVLAPLLLPILDNNGTQYFGSSLVRVGPGGPFLPVTSRVGTAIGTSVGDNMPGQVAGLIQKLTALGGKHGRGRVYTGFMTEVFNTVAGAPSPAYQALLNNYGVAMSVTRTIVVGAASSAVRPVVYNRFSNTGQIILSCPVSTKWATQRRRGAYGKVNAVPF